MTVRFEFKPQDCWIGVFWKTTGYAYIQYDLWVCLLPCFPLHFTWERKAKLP